MTASLPHSLDQPLHFFCVLETAAVYDLIGGECAFSTLSLLAGGGLFALADTAVSVQSVDLNFVIMSSGGGA